MMKKEFEKLIGREIPSSVYLEIEQEYMESPKEKAEFAAEWTAERIDNLICKRYFEMEMKVLEADAKITGYQGQIQKWQERCIMNDHSLRAKRKEIDELWDEIGKKDKEIERLETAIRDLKAKLYDKKTA